MFFIILCTVSYLFIYIKLNKGKIKYSEMVLPLLIFSIIFTIDIALTTAASWNVNSHDEITIRGIFSVFLYQEGSPWNSDKFNRAYGYSLFVSTALTIIFMGTLLIDRVRFNK